MASTLSANKIFGNVKLTPTSVWQREKRQHRRGQCGGSTSTRLPGLNNKENWPTGWPSQRASTKHSARSSSLLPALDSKKKDSFCFDETTHVCFTSKYHALTGNSIRHRCFYKWRATLASCVHSSSSCYWSKLQCKPRLTVVTAHKTTSIDTSWRVHKNHRHSWKNVLCIPTSLTEIFPLLLTIQGVEILVQLSVDCMMLPQHAKQARHSCWNMQQTNSSVMWAFCASSFDSVAFHQQALIS